MSPQRARAATGIGSSQIAALVGLHPYRDILDIFNELALGVQQKRRPELTWGQYKEPAILAYRAGQLAAFEWPEEAYRDHVGAERHLGGTTVRSVESPIAIASCDAVFKFDVEEPEGAFIRQVEETKNVGFHESWDWGDGDDQCPVGYRLQNLWQQGCLGIWRGELVASIAGAPPAAWPVQWDARLFGNLVIIAERFWHDHVLPRKPPRAIDGSDAATAYLRARYPEETEPMSISCPADLAELALEWEQVDEWAGAATARAKDLKNRICDRIAEKVGYVLPDRRWLSWKAQNTAHGGRTRVLRITKGNRKRS